MSGVIKYFEHKNYDGDSGKIEDVESLKENALHRLPKLRDNVSSLQWDLPKHVVVVMYEHDHGLGRQFAMWGKGGAEDLERHGIEDEFTCWKWARI